MYRALFGLPFLAVIAMGERRRHGPMPGRSRRLAAIAGLFFAGDLIFWHYAIGAVGAGLATVLANLQVIVVGLVAWLLLGERPSRSVLVALPVVLVGVVLISGVVGQGAYGEDPGLGVVLGLLTAVCYAGYLLVIRGVGRDLRRPAGPVTVATAATAVSAAGVGIALGTLQVAPGPSSLFWLALLGITAQFGGSLLIAVSLPAAAGRRDLDHPALAAGRDGRPGDGAARRGAVGSAAGGRRSRDRRDRLGDRAAGSRPDGLRGETRGAA